MSVSKQKPDRRLAHCHYQPFVRACETVRFYSDLLLAEQVLNYLKTAHE